MFSLSPSVPSFGGGDAAMHFEFFWLFTDSTLLPPLLLYLLSHLSQVPNRKAASTSLNSQQFRRSFYSLSLFSLKLKLVLLWPFFHKFKTNDCVNILVLINLSSPFNGCVKHKDCSYFKFCNLKRQKEISKVKSKSGNGFTILSNRLLLLHRHVVAGKKKILHFQSWK